MATTRIAATLLLTFGLAVHSQAADPAGSGQWPNWRGPQSWGSTNQGDYPTQLNQDNLLWKAELPGKGCSTPIVLDRMIYLTAPVQGKDALLAIDWSGAVSWSTLFGPETAGKHRNGSGCNASPATDGDGVFVYFKSGTLAAVEPDGSIRWQTNLVERYGEDNRFWDHGTSPVLTDEHVVMARMHAGDSWLAAFDKTSGETAWKVARNFPTPDEGDQCYTTPLVIQYQGRESLLVWGAMHLTIHDAADGRVVWTCGGFNPDQNPLWPAIATPAVVGDMAVVCYGRNDRNQPELHGVRLAGQGDVTKTSRVWSRNDTGTFVPSPAVYAGQVYLVRDKGEVECIDPQTGTAIWSAALPEHRNKYYASPVIANGILYAPREDGVVFVASVLNGFKLLAENDLQEPMIGSPVPVQNRLLIRSEQHLFCFQAAGSR